MQKSPVYLVGHLNDTIYILSRSTGNEPLLAYYKRRARTFGDVRDILTSQESPFARKLHDRTELTWTAYGLNLPDLSTHIAAIDTLMEPNGGASAFLLSQDDGVVVQPTWIVGIFTVVGSGDRQLLRSY